MPKKKSATSGTQKPVKRTAATVPASKLFSDEERAAMRDYVREKRAEARPKRAGEASDDSEVLAKIATLNEPDRSMGRRLHAIIMASAPSLTAKLWYGMPAYAKDGNVICFFQPGQKFKTRYATFGFSDKAKLDDGDMWPASFALQKLTAAEEARIAALVKRAAG